MRKTIVAVYHDTNTAHQVVSDLVNAGIERSNIGLAVGDTSGEGARYLTGEHVDAGEGAAFGAVMGGLTGLLVGLGMLAIPGVGPILAAGPLAAGLGGALVGAGAGAATGGMVGALIELGVPSEEAGLYTEAVRRGNALVTATVHEDRLETATQIMRQHNPVDMEQRASQWREGGWDMWDPNVDPFTAEELAAERIRHSSSNVGADYSPRAYKTGFDDYHDAFHSHYTQGDSTLRGLTWDQAMPAYRYGYSMGGNSAYRGRSWDEIETEARSGWEHNHPNTTWEEFKHMVRYAWEQVKDAVGAD